LNFPQTINWGFWGYHRPGRGRLGKLRRSDSNQSRNAKAASLAESGWKFLVVPRASPAARFHGACQTAASAGQRSRVRPHRADIELFNFFPVSTRRALKNLLVIKDRTSENSDPSLDPKFPEPKNPYVKKLPHQISNQAHRRRIRGRGFRNHSQRADHR